MSATGPDDEHDRRKNKLVDAMSDIPPGYVRQADGSYSKGQRAETHITADAVHRESDLHSQIIAKCREWGWQYLHGSMAAETHRTLSEPDFTLLADRSRVFFIECKSRDGKLSPGQLAFLIHAERNGHKIHVVRSMTEFLEIVK